MDIKDIYTYSINELKDKEEKYIDTELLLSYVLKKDRLFIKLNLDYPIVQEEEMTIKKYVKELKNDKPIHYITGIRDFYGENYFVEKNVLIPRSDTEILVDNAINVLKNKNKELRGLEIGIGSGIISISLLKHIENLEMIAIDINPYALELSKKNAENLGVLDRLNIIKSDLFENLIGEKFDFIISNPPYINEEDMTKLPNKVKKYEPENALYADNDGIYFYDEILKNAKLFLNEEFCIFFEIGYNQGEKIKYLFQKYEYRKKIDIINDLQNNNRVIIYK